MDGISLRSDWICKKNPKTEKKPPKTKNRKEKNSFKKMQPIINTGIGLAWGYLEAQSLGERKERKED